MGEGCSTWSLSSSAAPRSQGDYIELAREFHTVLLANVQPMGSGTDDAARRFIAMVDEFYERHVKLILSAAVPMQALYGNGLLNFEFKRLPFTAPGDAIARIPCQSAPSLVTIPRLPVGWASAAGRVRATFAGFMAVKLAGDI